MKKIIILILLLLTPTLVNAETNYLYDVLKDEAENNGLAREYTGEHHDSFTEEPSKKIYHWYAENDEEGNQVLEKNNVIFGDHCWQMIRTTDTGGVKLIYNGIPNEGKCNNNGESTQIGTSQFNEAGNSVAYVGYMYNPDTLILNPRSAKAETGSLFGTGVTYSNGEYTLTNTSTYNNNHHYTCNNTSGKCETVRYYFLNDYEYTVLNDGKIIEEVLEDMINSNDVNKKDSEVKETIDKWYKENLINYSDFIEDTIYCNDRSVIDYGGWNPNGGSIREYLKFANYTTSTNLQCINDTDKFSTKNNLAKLTYPVGLMTIPEALLVNANNIFLTGEYYWLLSPRCITTGYANVSGIHKLGGISSEGADASYGIGVRPVISLIPETIYSSGNGTKDKPFIIRNLNINEVNDEKKGELIIDDYQNLKEGDTVSFRIKPKPGYEVEKIEIIDENNNKIDYTTTDNINFRFTMPATDITIKPQYKEINPNTINPNTKRQILLIVISALILSIMTIIFVKKKKRLT